MHRAAGPTTSAMYASASTAGAAPSTSGFVSESALDAVVVELIRHASGFAKKRPDGAVDEDEDDDGVHDDVERDREARATLERIGERIGERAAERVSRGLTPCAAEQDAIMRACKEFWTFVHG